MNELDIQERDHYLSLSPKDKKKYLKDHLIVILDERKEGDTWVWEVDLSDKMTKVIKENQKDDESFNDAGSRFINEALRQFIDTVDTKKVKKSKKK